MNPPRIYFWILEQNQSHLFANVLKHNSIGIFALWRFEQILRWWVKTFPNSFTRSNIAWENSRHLETLNHWFPRQMTSEKRAQKFHADDSWLPRSNKLCQRYFSGNAWKLLCPQIWNIEKEKDRENEKVGDRVVKLNEKKSDKTLEREIKNKGDEFRWKDNMKILYWRWEIVQMLGENERQWKMRKTEQEHKQQNLLWAQRHFRHKTCNWEVSLGSFTLKKCTKKCAARASCCCFLLIRPRAMALD